MPDKTNVLQAVFAAVDEVNQQLRRHQRLEKNESVILTGEGGRLDSLGLVNLIFAVEQQVERVFGVTLTLADEMAEAGDGGAFRSLGSLAARVQALLEARQHG